MAGKNYQETFVPRDKLPMGGTALMCQGPQHTGMLCFKVPVRQHLYEEVVKPSDQVTRVDKLTGRKSEPGTD